MDCYNLIGTEGWVQRVEIFCLQYWVVHLKKKKVLYYKKKFITKRDRPTVKTMLHVIKNNSQTLTPTIINYVLLFKENTENCHHEAQWIRNSSWIVFLTMKIRNHLMFHLMVSLRGVTPTCGENGKNTFQEVRFGFKHYLNSIIQFKFNRSSWTIR